MPQSDLLIDNYNCTCALRKTRPAKGKQVNPIPDVHNSRKSRLRCYCLNLKLQEILLQMIIKSTLGQTWPLPPHWRHMWFPAPPHPAQIFLLADCHGLLLMYHNQKQIQNRHKTLSPYKCRNEERMHTSGKSECRRGGSTHRGSELWQLCPGSPELHPHTGLIQRRWHIPRHLWLCTGDIWGCCLLRVSLWAALSAFQSSPPECLKHRQTRTTPLNPSMHT